MSYTSDRSNNSVLSSGTTLPNETEDVANLKLPDTGWGCRGVYHLRNMMHGDVHCSLVTNWADSFKERYLPQPTMNQWNLFKQSISKDEYSAWWTLLTNTPNPSHRIGTCPVSNSLDQSSTGSRYLTVHSCYLLIVHWISISKELHFIVNPSYVVTISKARTPKRDPNTTHTKKG